MEEVELHFDFERTLQAGSPIRHNRGSQPEEVRIEPPDLPATVIGQQPGNFKKNYRQTVCTYWLKGLCMKGDSCGFLHQLDPARMPVCRALLKYGVCKEADCLFKHSLDDIKECNMYKLGFCIYGPQCRYKHTRVSGPPPDPELIEAAKPREYRNINIVVNEVNPNIATGDLKPSKRGSNSMDQIEGGEFGNRQRYLSQPDSGGSLDGSSNNSIPPSNHHPSSSHGVPPPPNPPPNPPSRHRQQIPPPPYGYGNQYPYRNEMQYGPPGSGGPMQSSMYS
ncbi:hypothetical protein BSKO_06667 [Bryopsis sp. KO-2023]|nr:hypothetical protein BSKO_06667 [Bryopsis sp. KO-2023]